ncbi:CPBP family intramembrane metalloprotease [Aureibaculum algae]|uniref:CPBP family intramembrane metalloprotease n=1 Tax=Aureibaculum algae TaxID=2584122 RepID=A0A5B7TQ44_9FLAO|nr:type II CAAX endopeptidase family protein [Aureibaculum algae]QCX37571.1 CPBP family intramembrane metalloprotease [Aureibaculum algae]
MTYKSNNGWLRVLALIIPYFIFIVFFQFIGAIIAGVSITNIETNSSLWQNLIISFFNLLGVFSLLHLFMKNVDKEKFINLGFSIKGRFKELYLGFLIGAIVMALGYILLIIIDEIKFNNIEFNLKELVISLFLYFFVAVAEEALARGYVLKNFMLSFNKYIALILSSLLFAVMHLANPNMDWFSFLNLFLAGILLGMSYIYTKNLWFPIALHFSWNLFQTLFGFNVSGQDFYSLVEFKITDKNLLNGGDFGFEGSIFSVVFQLVIIGSIWAYYQKKRKIKT